MVGGTPALLVAFACSAEQKPDQDDGTSAPPDLTLAWTAEEAVESVAELLQDGFPDPILLRDLYLELMAYGDTEPGGCPGDPLVMSDEVVLGCTASSGWTYSGISTYESGTGEDARTGWGFSGDFRIISPDSETYTVAGDVHALALHDDEGQSDDWNMRMHGSWLSSWHDGSLGRGLSARVDYVRLDTELEISGVMQSGESAVDFERLLYDDTLEDCEAGYDATIWIRDPSGLWLTWSNDCGLCGELALDDELVSDAACLDLRGLDGPLDALVEEP